MANAPLIPCPPSNSASGATLCRLHRTSFDPLAVVVDWLDACRLAKLDDLLDDGAVFAGGGWPDRQMTSSMAARGGRRTAVTTMAAAPTVVWKSAAISGKQRIGHPHLCLGCEARDREQREIEARRRFGAPKARKLCAAAVTLGPSSEPEWGRAGAGG